ncbi:unnamed protein product, partial [Ectocarpus sp. 13 AM-2016]
AIPGPTRGEVQSTWGAVGAAALRPTDGSRGRATDGKQPCRKHCCVSQESRQCLLQGGIFLRIQAPLPHDG